MKKINFWNFQIPKSWLLATIIFLTNMSVSAQVFVSDDGLNYNILSESDRTVEVISGSERYSGDIVIPSEVNYNSRTYSVTSINRGAFSSCGSLTSVSLPHSVISIDAPSLFIGCNSLDKIDVADNNPAYASVDGILYSKDITTLIICPAGKKGEISIPNSVTSIGKRAFANCSSLTSVTIPNSVTTIGDSAFQSCSGLTSMTIPNSVTSIGNSAFYGCSGLISVTIPNSVTSIGNSAFQSCSNLTSVTIPDSVTSIGNGAFNYCSSIEKIDVADNNPAYASVDGILYSKDITTLIICPEGKKGEISIPNSVTSIGDSAFYGCSGLTSVTIPNSVTSIGNKAFASCIGLTAVTIPNSVTSINREAFHECSGLTSISISNSVTSIDGGVFGGCSSLVSVTIPESVTTIGNAFYNCNSLEKIDVAENNKVYTSVDGILYSKNLTTLIICPIGKKGEISIPNSVTSIGNSAFSNCSNLTAVTIPNSVTTIGKWAFASCSSLTSVTIPNSVTSINEYAFQNCSGLTSMTIPNLVTSIERGTFDRCSSLTSVSIPESVTSIGLWVFYGCSNLTSVSIPESVTSIGSETFNGCSSLTSVYCHWNNPIESMYIFGFFNEIEQKAKLYVPKGCIDKYRAVAPWKDFVNIEEIDYSGIDDAMSAGRSVKVSVENGVITVGGIDDNAVIAVYDMQGRVVYTGTEHTVTDLPAAIYIVKAGNEIVKIAM